ncbi:YciI family protein [Micromonospora sp. NPDC093244]|uniref:YciI family protein n=1 Tax=Micromonospora sp. NPDC093244 TaxID=3155071 RepID=UPI003442DD05
MSLVPRYLLSVYGPAEHTESGTCPSGKATPQASADAGAFTERLRRDGHFVFADSLEPVTTATTVDGQGGKPVLTDGPYLETAEQLDGFWVVEAADLDVALVLAAEGSRACGGAVEVRPFRTEGSDRTLPQP